MNRIDQAVAVQDWMVSHRRHLHQQPEVGIDLPDTHAYLCEVLRDLGWRTESHPAAGVTVRVAGSEPDGNTVVLRADMDALPVAERAVVPFASERPGAMHACGHDLHMSMLLGVAKVLADVPPRRDTVLAFQPGEESDRGALAVLGHTNLDITDPATAFAIHVHAMGPPGAILHRPGVFMGFGDWFTITLAGPGGHASQPHLAGNPIEAAADITTRLKALTADLGRRDKVVATITESLIGNTVNVIPASGRLRGTIRTLSAGSRTALIHGMREIVSTALAEHRLTGEVAIHEGYPAVVNDGDYVSRFVERVTRTELAPQLTPMTHPSMVIEDFAYFLQRWPGAMVYLGARGVGNDSFNHADDVVYDEGAMATGAALYLLAADGI